MTVPLWLLAILLLFYGLRQPELPLSTVEAAASTLGGGAAAAAAAVESGDYRSDQARLQHG